MKNLFTLFILTTYLLSLSAFWLIQLRILASDATLESKLDKSEYQNSKLLQIKIPMHLPYWTNGKEFERTNGQVQLGGVYYKFVKRIIKEDTLFLLCIPNEIKTQLSNSAAKMLNQEVQLHGSLKKGGLSFKVLSLKTMHDLNLTYFKFNNSAFNLSSQFYEDMQLYQSPFKAGITQPPEA